MGQLEPGAGEGIVQSRLVVAEPLGDGAEFRVDGGLGTVLMELTPRPGF